MVVCGIDISGSTAIVVLLECSQDDYTIVETDFKRVELKDDKNQGLVKSFSEVIDNFLRQNGVEKVFVRRPAMSGKFQASATAFKIEAIIQLLDIKVDLLHATTTSSRLKKKEVAADRYTKLNKYQHSALNVAVCGLDL